MVSAAGGEETARLIVHYEKIPAVEVPVHFFDLLLVNNIGLLDAIKLRW